jgi:uncharacterized protein (UPF0276 family)
MAPPTHSATWRDLPELGVGLVYMPGLASAIAEASDALDYIEVEPQQHWLRRTHGARELRLDYAEFETIRELRKPCLLHSVGCPIGGTFSLLDQHAAMLRESVAALDPAWVSEHLSFNQFQHAGVQQHASFLLPPLPCAASVATAVRGLGALRAVVARPLLFETGVNYLRAQPGEWSDGRFVRAVAEQADCGILLDLHNAWTNARNGRQPLDAFLDELPLDRVVELHLAGGESLDGYWLDAHSGLTPPELLRFAIDLVPRLPRLRAITFEMMDEAMSNGACDPARLHAHLIDLQCLWSTRGSWVSSPNDGYRDEPSTPGDWSRAPKPETWEDTLGALVIGIDEPIAAAQDPALTRRLLADPGLAILRTLVQAVRAGSVVELLRLGTRLLVLARGREFLSECFTGFWRESSPQPFATDEAIRFGEYLLALRLDVPGLDDILRVEIATCRAVADDNPVELVLDRDPAALIAAIERGELPPPLAQSMRSAVA